ncbi:MAG TPA: hypothetical protein VL137_00855 [Polyangiaceae bacterium]|nr:hypothetical protein [Polyangiaceae bacterium]
MQETRELKTALLSLADPSLRTQWLRQKLERWPSSVAALALAELLDESDSANAPAKQATYSLVAAIVRDPAAALWSTLREEARRRDLLSLQRLLRRDEPLPSLLDDNVEPPVPDYGAGRELTLGERRSLARRPNRKWIDRLLHDPHVMVVELLLNNPKLTEADVLRLSASRKAQRAVLAAIVRAERWLSLSRVRLSLILNPRTASELSVPLLFLCTRPELLEIKNTANLALCVRATAADLLQRRPPRRKGNADSSLLH